MMAPMADKKRSERKFRVEKNVELRLYRQISVRESSHPKLNHWYYGPYCMLNKNMKGATHLHLPGFTKTHSTFHKSELKESMKEEQATSRDLSTLKNIEEHQKSVEDWKLPTLHVSRFKESLKTRQVTVTQWPNK